MKITKNGVVIISKKKINDYSTGIPIHIVTALARSVLPEIQAFYESKEGQEYFEKWKAEQKQKDKST